MNEVSANPTTHVIIFHDGSRKFITAPQASLIFQASAGVNKSITTPQLGMITFSAIAKLIEMKDYYDQYPDDRPDYRPEFQPEPEVKLTVEQITENNKRGFSGVLRGLKSFIDEELNRGNKPMKALSVYNEKLAKYKKLYATSSSP